MGVMLNSVSHSVITKKTSNKRLGVFFLFISYNKI